MNKMLDIRPIKNEYRTDFKSLCEYKKATNLRENTEAYYIRHGSRWVKITPTIHIECLFEFRRY